MTDILRAVSAGITSRLPKSGGSLQLISRLVHENARDYVKHYLIAFGLMGISSWATGASAWIMRDVINDIFIKRDSHLMWIIAGAVSAIYLIKGTAIYFQTTVLNRIGNNIIARNQKRLFAHIVGQDVDFFQRMALGDLVVRISQNANSAREVLDLIVTSIGRDLMSVVALTSVMLFQDPLMSMVAFVTMPAAVWGVSKLVKQVRNIIRSEFKSLVDVVSVVQETALGIKIVKAFNLQDKMLARMNRAVDQIEARSNSISSLSAMTSPLMETLGGLAISGVILYGGYSVTHLGRDPGTFFAFITSLLLAYEPAKRLARIHLQMEGSLIGVRLLYDMLDSPPRGVERSGPSSLCVSEGGVRLENVTFHYGQTPAVEDLSLHFPAGKMSALIGPSGAGKSTVLSLIERFYDPDQGRILIDHQDIRDVTHATLRSAIAIVTQDTFLFEGSVRDNIANGRSDASHEEIVAAARAANAHGFIMETPGGYDANVGEGGGRLSGGQRQRIAIARAMLRNAPILLLDEATSALDSASEALVQEALDRLMVGRTTIVIAHRLSTIRRADIIHVLQNGRVVQSGNHRSLIGEVGVYAHLYELQFRAPEDQPTL